MTTILISFLLAIITLVLGWLWGRTQMQKTLVVKEAELAKLTNDLTHAHSQADRTIAQVTEHYETLLADRERQQHMLREQHAIEREAWQRQVMQLAEQVAHQQSERLRVSNRQQIDELLQPLSQSIQQFQKNYIEGQAKLDANVKHILERSLEIGHEAQALANALRGDNKKQGDWGEGILENLLQSSGLTKGRDYDTQYSVKGAKGNELRPDVIVSLPDSACIVIDAKVSLTAYVDYHIATTTEEEQRALKAHLQSVERHIDELSAKQYPKYVRGAIGFVLMFIPNEAAYLAAIQANPQLSQYAYAKQVILLNPSNLLMTLQLAYHLNQAQQQQQNVQEVFDSARKVYDKFVTFARTFNKVETRLKGVLVELGLAKGQLATGQGNILRQLEGWRTLGLTPQRTFDVKDLQQLEQPLELFDVAASTEQNLPQSLD